MEFRHCTCYVHVIFQEQRPDKKGGPGQLLAIPAVTRPHIDWRTGDDKFYSPAKALAGSHG